ncbi:MAG TPA: YibE/F family protein [Candidatus Paceibacterota bacterium]|nr:YibE/F family protein [Candidatus Paceibacterota bacterium]
MKTLARGLLFPILCLVALAPLAALAQDTAIQDTDLFERARVITVTDEGTAPVAGTNVTSTKQRLTATVLSGPDKGKTVTFENDFTQLAVGQTFYARHITNVNDGTDLWSVADPYRLPVLIGLAIVFLVLLFLFGGMQGLRGLMSLIASIFVIFYLLIPSIYAGHSPILVSIGVAALIIILGSYITHGFNRTTTSAMLGMLVTVLITGIATYAVIHLGHFSGFTSETNVYLNFDTDGRISMIGLLFGGIMIGLLGVLYDIAIGQAVAVEELYIAGQYSSRQVFNRAMRIGREHIGALVNTLAIAYVGTALPLMLLFKETTDSIGYLLNGEIFATEIVRILMGSIGLVLAVPITTLLSVYLLQNVRSRQSSIHSHSHLHSDSGE